MKKKIKNLIAHPQDITNHILEYNVSTSSTKNVAFLVECLSLFVKMKLLKRHADCSAEI